MRWLPFVSREMHLAVIAAKNEVIFNLQRHVASLEEQLKNPAPVNVKVEMPTVQIPTPVANLPRRKPRNPITEQPDEVVIDWAGVDENNPEQLARIAAAELGTNYTPYMLASTVTRIKSHVRQAKLAKAKALLQEGQIRSGISPEAPGTEEEAVAQGGGYVPAHIRELIESAERV